MNAAALKRPDVMTVDEFVAWSGDGRGTRYELVEGRLRAQDAPSDAHGTIHSNVVSAIHNHFRSHNLRCRVIVGGGVRPQFRADWNYRVPDIAVTCAPNTAGGHDIPEPKLLIELLSKSNAQDTWDNVRNYMTIPSVEEIVLIGTEYVEAQVIRRGPDKAWPANPAEVPRLGPLPIDAIGLHLAMADIYWGTHLAGRVG